MRTSFLNVAANILYVSVVISTCFAEFETSFFLHV